MHHGPDYESGLDEHAIETQVRLSHVDLEIDIRRNEVTRANTKTWLEVAASHVVCAPKSPTHPNL
jgi:hypothetical protein